MSAFISYGVYNRSIKTIKNDEDIDEGIDEDIDDHASSCSYYITRR